MNRGREFEGVAEPGPRTMCSKGEKSSAVAELN